MLLSDSAEGIGLIYVQQVPTPYYPLLDTIFKKNQAVLFAAGNNQMTN